MLINEYRKIWNWRVLTVILVIGTVLFFSGPMSQMNLKNLPLFETVEVTVGTELREQYGKELDAGEIEEIKIIAQEKKDQLNEKVMQAFSQLKEAGFAFYDEFSEYMSSADYETVMSDEFSAFEDLQWEIYDLFSWEIEEMSYYYEGIINNYEWVEDKESYVISVVPPQVVSNMRFVMEEFAQWILILVILLVIPYLAWDNRAGVYPLIAATKTGRKIFLKQVLVMFTSTMLLILICDVTFGVALHWITPYEPFYDCIVENAIYDWTLTQLYTAQVVIINVAAIGMAMIVFILSALCQTIVGMAAVMIPCWFMTTVISSSFLGRAFLKLDAGNDFWINLQAALLSVPVQVCVVWVAVGIALLTVLYTRKKREDIFE